MQLHGYKALKYLLVRHLMTKWLEAQSPWFVGVMTYTIALGDDFYLFH